MKIALPYRRLFSLWGWIDRQHNARIAGRLPEDRKGSVLDLGCGYGSLVNYLVVNGWQAEGIDNDAEVMSIASALFPGVPLKLMDVGRLREEYPPGSFTAVILKDSFHHLVNVADVQQILKHIHAILCNEGRLVILDPNPTWIVRTARRIISHKDPEAHPEIAIKLLAENGFKVLGLEYFEVIGLPLSGGYVGIQMAPNWKPLNWLVAMLNTGLSALVNTLGLGHSLCWRYLVYADKEKQAKIGN
jgi:SAM-dependent methyltransferase